MRNSFVSNSGGAEHDVTKIHVVGQCSGQTQVDETTNPKGCQLFDYNRRVGRAEAKPLDHTDLSIDGFLFVAT